MSCGVLRGIKPHRWAWTKLGTLPTAFTLWNELQNSRAADRVPRHRASVPRSAPPPCRLHVCVYVSTTLKTSGIKHRKCSKELWGVLLFGCFSLSLGVFLFGVFFSLGCFLPPEASSRGTFRRTASARCWRTEHPPDHGPHENTRAMKCPQ